MKQNILFENKDFIIEIEPFEIPWVKIFTKYKYKELCDLPKILKYNLFDLVDFIETDFKISLQAHKVNIASFGNYLPHLHIHVQARFEDDSYFPESTWGQKQREGKLRKFDDYFLRLSHTLKRLYCE